MKNYFPHDHYARSDKKLIKVMRVLGLSGIGLYWCIIEMLFEENGWLKLADLDNIAYDLRTETATINTLLKDFDLFFTTGERFSSKSVQARLKMIEDKSSQRSKAAKARWDKYKEDANAMQMHSECNAIKRKEIKLNEKKLKEIKYFRKGDFNKIFFWVFITKGNAFFEALNKKEKEDKRKKVAPKKEKETINFGAFDTPEFRAKWQEFLEHRRKIKAAITTTASEQRIFNQLTAFDIPFAIQLIEATVDSGKWQGLVFKDTPAKFQQYQGKPKPTLSISQDDDAYSVKRNVA